MIPVIFSLIFLLSIISFLKCCSGADLVGELLEGTTAAGDSEAEESVTPDCPEESLDMPCMIKQSKRCNICEGNCHPRDLA
jgi:hypothetical protein